MLWRGFLREVPVKSKYISRCLKCVENFKPVLPVSDTAVIFSRGLTVSDVSLEATSPTERAKDVTSAFESHLTAPREWNIAPRTIAEAVLNDYAMKPSPVKQVFILHGPSGSGKHTVLKRLLKGWNEKGHVAAYVDYHNHQIRKYADPSRFGSAEAPIAPERLQIEQSLEFLAVKGALKGTFDESTVFRVLSRRHWVEGSLKHVLGGGRVQEGGFLEGGGSQEALFFKALGKVNNLGLLEPKFGETEAETEAEFEQWRETLKLKPDQQTDDGLESTSTSQAQEAPPGRTLLALALAKQVLRVQELWRREGKSGLRVKGQVDGKAGDAEVAWTVLLVDILSRSVRPGTFQPKLVVYGAEALRESPGGASPLGRGDSTFHDAMLTRILESAGQAGILPVLLASSDSYYSLALQRDFSELSPGFTSHELFSWAPEEASLLLVPHSFRRFQWKMVADHLGANPRHLAAFHWLWSQRQALSPTAPEKDESGEELKDSLEEYLGHVLETEIVPAMTSAADIVAQFPITVASGKLPPDFLSFGLAWNALPGESTEGRALWAKVQLADFVVALRNAQFGLNYSGEASKELEMDPCFHALLRVGILYRQRSPTYVRPSSLPVEHCLQSWLRFEMGQWSWQTRVYFLWQRLYRGRSYRHLVKQ